jgi:hypothetical protein
MIRTGLVIASGDEDRTRTRTTTRNAGCDSGWKETRGEDTDGWRRISTESYDLLIIEIESASEEGRDKGREWEV